MAGELPGGHDGGMSTLHIEHPITDFTIWRAAFERLAPAREGAGMTAQRVRRPVDDDHYVIVDLEFPDQDRARGFLAFLEQKVWSTPANSPALAGSPIARVLEDAL
jgi:hypothetical protein